MNRICNAVFSMQILAYVACSLALWAACDGPTEEDCDPPEKDECEYEGQVIWTGPLCAYTCTSSKSE